MKWRARRNGGAMKWPSNEMGVEWNDWGMEWLWNEWL